MISPEEFRALPLRVHGLLAGVPLHDVWAVDLPRARGPMTLDALYRRTRANGSLGRYPVPVRALVGLRLSLGRIFGLDRAPSPRDGGAPFAARLTPEDRARSSVPPGTRQGMFSIVYRYANEQLVELANRTVHAAAASALAETATGYRFYFAVYVAKAGFATALYMALIDPFRKYVVYPALLRNIRDAWGTCIDEPASPQGGDLESERESS
jgi:hypothetical protein